MENEVLIEKSEQVTADKSSTGRFFYKSASINLKRIANGDKKPTLKSMMKIVKAALKKLIKGTEQDECLSVYSTGNAIIITKDKVQDDVEISKEDIRRRLEDPLIKTLVGNKYDDKNKIVFEDEEDRIEEIFDAANSNASDEVSNSSNTNDAEDDGKTGIDYTNLVGRHTCIPDESMEEAIKECKSMMLVERDNANRQCHLTEEDMKKGFKDPCIRFNESNFPLGYFVHEPYALDTKYINIDNVIQLINRHFLPYPYPESSDNGPLDVSEYLCDDVILDVLDEMYNCDIDGYIKSIYANYYRSYYCFPLDKNAGKTRLQSEMYTNYKPNRPKTFRYEHSAAMYDVDWCEHTSNDIPCRIKWSRRSRTPWHALEDMDRSNELSARVWNEFHNRHAIEVCLLAQCDDNLESLCDAFPIMGNFIDECHALFSEFQTHYTIYDEGLGDLVNDVNNENGLASRSYYIPFTSFQIPMKSIPDGFQFILRSDYERFIHGEIKTCEIYLKTFNIYIDACGKYVVPRSTRSHAIKVTDHIKYRGRTIGDFADSSYNTSPYKKLERIKETECLLLAEAATVTEGYFFN